MGHGVVFSSSFRGMSTWDPSACAILSGMSDAKAQKRLGKQTYVLVSSHHYRPGSIVYLLGFVSVLRLGFAMKSSLGTCSDLYSKY